MERSVATGLGGVGILATASGLSSGAQSKPIDGLQMLTSPAHVLETKVSDEVRNLPPAKPYDKVKARYYASFVYVLVPRTKFPRKRQTHKRPQDKSRLESLLLAVER